MIIKHKMGYKKGTRITDPNVLERLKKARVKALEVRKANAARKKKERDLAKIERGKKAADTDAKLKAHAAGKAEAPPKMVVTQVNAPKAPAPSPSPAPAPPPSMTLEEKAPVVTKKKKKRVQIAYDESSSSSSSEEEQVIRRRKRRPKGVRRLRRTVDSMQQQIGVLQKEREDIRRHAALQRQKQQQRQKVRSEQEMRLDAMFKRNYGRR